MTFLKSLRVIVIVFGVSLMILAPLAWETLFSFGRGMSSTGCNTHCNTEWSDWLSEEAVYIFWIPFCIGFLITLMAWPISRKIRRLQEQLKNNSGN